VLGRRSTASQEQGGEQPPAVPTTRAGDAAVPADADAPEIRLRPRPRAQSLQPRAPSPRPYHLQATTLRRDGRVAEPRQQSSRAHRPKFSLWRAVRVRLTALPNRLRPMLELGRMMGKRWRGTWDVVWRNGFHEAKGEGVFIWREHTAELFYDMRPISREYSTRGRKHLAIEPKMYGSQSVRPSCIRRACGRALSNQVHRLVSWRR
jgi:hypothetical protein